MVTNLDRMAGLQGVPVCESYISPETAPGMDDFFTLQAGHITGIRISPNPADLTREAERTRLLGQMQPVYTGCEPATYLERISETLGTPIAMTSYGSTALEKRIIWESPKPAVRHHQPSAKSDHLP